MSKKKTVAIFGVGRAGSLHCENIAAFQDVEVKYVVDPYATDAQQEWAKGLGWPAITADADAAFNDPEVDSVLIFSATPTHTEYILKAAAQGKDIFCEKPIDKSLENCLKVKRAVEAAGVKFMLAFVRRFDHNHAKVSKIVRSGQLGKPELLSIISKDPHISSKDFIMASGGLFFDMMIHDFDMARYLVGSDIVEVFATGNVLVDESYAECGDVDTSVVALKFANGALGQITCSRRSAFGYDQRNEVHCEKGMVQAYNDAPDNVRVSDVEGVKEEKPLYFMFERYNDAFAAEVREFFAAIDEDRAPCVGVDDGIKATAAAMAAKVSLDENRPVRLKEVCPQIDNL